jgi:hypothetical protein
VRPRVLHKDLPLGRDLVDRPLVLITTSEDPDFMRSRMLFSMNTPEGLDKMRSQKRDTQALTARFSRINETGMCAENLSKHPSRW